MPPVVGVCSWSLRPSSPADLVERVREIGVAAVQIELWPPSTGPWPCSAATDRLRIAGIEVRSAMMRMKGEDYTTIDSIRRTGGVRPDEHWCDNAVSAVGVASLAAEIGIPLVTLHAGFLPDDRGDPNREVMLGRLRELADAFASFGVRLGLETGQESAATLLDALDELDRPDVGINFDPANMILYGAGDPIEAFQRLAPRVVQIHVKDATPSDRAGEWGRESPVGHGAVDWRALFDAHRKARLGCDWMIERESGAQRLDELRATAALVRSFIPSKAAPANS